VTGGTTCAFDPEPIRSDGEVLGLLENRGGVLLWVVDENGLGRAGPSPEEHPMVKRIPASIRTREALQALIEVRLVSPAGRSELVELATRLIVEEAWMLIPE
jgi:hypothetical protein